MNISITNKFPNTAYLMSKHETNSEDLIVQVNTNEPLQIKHTSMRINIIETTNRKRKINETETLSSDKRLADNITTSRKKSQLVEVIRQIEEYPSSEFISVDDLRICGEKDGFKGTNNDDFKDEDDQELTTFLMLTKPLKNTNDDTKSRFYLDSRIKIALQFKNHKFNEYLMYEGLIKSAQKCSNHPTNKLKLAICHGSFNDPYSGDRAWVSKCCANRVSIFKGSIFEDITIPPSSILKLIYHWVCQTQILLVMVWVEVDFYQLKHIYSLLRAVCTLKVHQKFRKLGGSEKYIEVGLIFDQEQNFAILGVFDKNENKMRLRVHKILKNENLKNRLENIFEILKNWIHKKSIIIIDQSIDKSLLYQKGFENVLQESAIDNTSEHTNQYIKEYLKLALNHLFTDELKHTSLQIKQQFLDEFVWREKYGSYNTLNTFDYITSHISEQASLESEYSFKQYLSHVAHNPFKDWSI